MNNQLAIKILKGEQSFVMDSERFYNQAVELGIKALEKQIIQKDSCQGCCYYDDSNINKHENYENLIPSG